MSNIEIDDVIRKVQKLLALANNNDNEHQAAAATEKAMALLEAYNLDMAVIGKSGKGAQRNDTTKKGGLYGWQRDLWQAVAELNFCRYWSIRGLAKGSTYEHRLLGSHANVVSTQVMADYLQSTVERLARDYAKLAFPGHSIFVKEMIAYREGLAARISERLRERRRQIIEEQEAKQREEAARARHPSAASNSHALVLADVIQTEEDLNNDYLNGLEPGTTAAYRAERKAAQAAATAAYHELVRKQAEWDEAHPVEAAARKAKEAAENEAYWAGIRAKEEKRAKRRKAEPMPRYRRETPAEERARMSTFGAGYRKGNDVGLEKQVDQNREKKLR